MTLPIPIHASQEVIDSTKIQCYQSCPRMFFYEYMLGWRSSYPSNHLHFGKCVHLALEHIILNGYSSDSIMAGVELFNTEYRMVFPASTDEIFTPKTPDNFFLCLVEYLKHWREDLIQYEVYKTEFGGTVSLGGDYKVAFKMDTILLDKYTNLYCSLEHKTTQGNYISPHYAVQHQMSTQCGTYTHVLNCIFPPENVSGVVINTLCFKRTKAPGFLLQRFPINLSNAMMYDWLTTTKLWIDQIRRDKATLSEETDRDDIMLAFPKNGRSCTNYNRTCTYLDLCQSWQNPLQHLDRMPNDLEINFWNPLEEDLREVLTL